MEAHCFLDNRKRKKVHIMCLFPNHNRSNNNKSLRSLDLDVSHNTNTTTSLRQIRRIHPKNNQHQLIKYSIIQKKANPINHTSIVNLP